jgi:micrococcal nuclease
MKAKFIAPLTIVLFFIILLLVLSRLAGLPQEPTSDDISTEIATVGRIIDGDTLNVDISGHSESVRLLGVDAADLDYEKPLTGNSQPCFALEAKAELARLLSGQKTAHLAPDPLNTNRDAYDRLLRYVYLEDGLLVNHSLIESGHGRFLARYPLTKSADFEAAEVEARAAGRGRWSACFTY